MTDIGLCAETFDAGGIAAANTNVVEHGGLFYKLAVHPQFRMGVAYLQRALADQAAVGDQDIF